MTSAMPWQARHATIAKLDRLRSSVNGNPRWRLHLVGGDTIDTGVDSMVAYKLGPTYVNVPVLLTLAPDDGRLIDVEHDSV